MPQLWFPLGKSSLVSSLRREVFQVWCFWTFCNWVDVFLQIYRNPGEADTTQLDGRSPSKKKCHEVPPVCRHRCRQFCCLPPTKTTKQDKHITRYKSKFHPQTAQRLRLRLLQLYKIHHVKLNLIQLLLVCCNNFGNLSLLGETKLLFYV